MICFLLSCCIFFSLLFSLFLFPMLYTKKQGNDLTVALIYWWKKFIWTFGSTEYYDDYNLSWKTTWTMVKADFTSLPSIIVDFFSHICLFISTHSYFMLSSIKSDKFHTPLVSPYNLTILQCMGRLWCEFIHLWLLRYLYTCECEYACKVNRFPLVNNCPPFQRLAAMTLCLDDELARKLLRWKKVVWSANYLVWQFNFHLIGESFIVTLCLMLRKRELSALPLVCAAGIIFWSLPVNHFNCRVHRQI